MASTYGFQPYNGEFDSPTRCEEQMKVEIRKTLYRGRPIIQLFDKDVSEEYANYPILSMGVRKVNAILACIEELEKFSKENEETKWKKQ